MDVLARCLINAGIWTEGNAYMARKSITTYITDGNIFIIKFLEMVQYDSAYILETPIGHPVFSKSFSQNDIQQILTTKKCQTPLQFLRTLEPPISSFQDCIYTADRYVVDARQFLLNNTFDEELYVKNLQVAAHRKSIKRFRNAFKNAKAELVILKAAEVMAWFDRLMPLHMEVQNRNRGQKDHVYLEELLQACTQYPDTYWCVVALNASKVPVSFGIYLLDDQSCFTGIDEGHMHKSVFLALVGNNRDEGGKISAYHNILYHGVCESAKRNAVMDLGLSHWSVKKVFEPLVIQQYLAYVGNSMLVKFALKCTNFLQSYNVIKSPLQRK